jgi:APA family basic amino acid/polyamine antiporter
VINAALILLRYKEPQLRRPFKVPLAIGKFPVLPLFGIVFCVFMLFQLEWKVLLVGAMLVVIGLVLSFVDMNKKDRR